MITQSTKFIWNKNLILSPVLLFSSRTMIETNLIYIHLTLLDSLHNYDCFKTTNLGSSCYTCWGQLQVLHIYLVDCLYITCWTKKIGYMLIKQWSLRSPWNHLLCTFYSSFFMITKLMFLLHTICLVIR